MAAWRWVDKKTKAERDLLILTLKAQGLTAEQIANQVNISPTGVRTVCRKAGKPFVRKSAQKQFLLGPGE